MQFAHIFMLLALFVIKLCCATSAPKHAQPQVLKDAGRNDKNSTIAVWEDSSGGIFFNIGNSRRRYNKRCVTVHKNVICQRNAAKLHSELHDKKQSLVDTFQVTTEGDPNILNFTKVCVEKTSHADAFVNDGWDINLTLMCWLDNIEVRIRTGTSARKSGHNFCVRLNGQPSEPTGGYLSCPNFLEALPANLPSETGENSPRIAMSTPPNMKHQVCFTEKGSGTDQGLVAEKGVWPQEIFTNCTISLCRVLLCQARTPNTHNGWCATYPLGSYDENEFVARGAHLNQAQSIIVQGRGCFAQLSGGAGLHSWVATYGPGTYTKNDFIARGAVANSARSLRVYKAITTCAFTFDDETTDVFYDGLNITHQVIGDMSSWRSVNWVSFIPAEKGVLAVSGRNVNDGDQDGCATAGFSMVCSDGTGTDDWRWQAFSSDEAADLEHKAGRGEGWHPPCLSTSGYKLPNFGVKKIYGSNQNHAVLRLRTTTSGLLPGARKREEIFAKMIGTTEQEVSSASHMPKGVDQDVNITVNCKFTMKGSLKAVYYNSYDITKHVSGQHHVWSSPKVFSFTQVAGAHLTIYGTTDQPKKGCSQAGLQIVCTNGITSGSDWTVTSADADINVNWLAGVVDHTRREMCQSTADFYLKDTAKMPRVWAMPGKHVAFRIMTGYSGSASAFAENAKGSSLLEQQGYQAPATSFIGCAFSVDDYVHSVYYDQKNLGEIVSGNLARWQVPKLVSFSYMSDAHLVVNAWNNAHKNQDSCITGGFVMACSNGITTGDPRWEAMGFDQVPNSTYQQGEGEGWHTPCVSKSPFSLRGFVTTNKIYGSRKSWAALRIKMPRAPKYKGGLWYNLRGMAFLKKGFFYKSPELVKAGPPVGKRQAFVRCSFTIDDVVSSVYYNGKDITQRVKGNPYLWLVPKRVSFRAVDGAYLVISGFDMMSNVPCEQGGFAISCSNGVTSNDPWEAYGSEAPTDEEHAAGGGAGWHLPCESKSNFFLKPRHWLRKINGANIPFAAFRIRTRASRGRVLRESSD